MRRFVTYRFLVATLWGILLVTVVVCAIGIRMTSSQYRNMQGILFEAEKRSALNQMRELEKLVVRTERSALRALVATGPDGPRPGSVPFLGPPFFIAADGMVSTGRVRTTAMPTTSPSEGLMPAEFERGIRLALTSVGLKDKLATLDALYRSDELSAPWRLRARAHMAALHQANQSPGVAAEIYEGIITEFDACLRSSTWPSFLHLGLARAEALAASAGPEETRDALGDVLTLLRTRRQDLTLDEEAYFVERAGAVLSELRVPVPVAFETARREIATERQAVSDIEHLRDRIWDAMQLDPPGAPDREPRQLLASLAGRNTPVVWLRADPSPGAVASGAVGCPIAVNALRDFLQDALSANGHSSSHRVFFTDASVTGPTISLATFPGTLGFLSIGQDRDVWDRLLAERRRPFVFAGAVIALLGVVLILSLVILFRGVTREFTLSRMKTEFVANVSHELKTPLALIRLCGETMLLGRVRTESQRSRYLQVITRESMRLSHLLNNVLNFSSIEAGKKTYEFRYCDLAGTLRETLGNYRYHLDEKGFAYDGDVPETLPLVNADEEAVAQAIINLLQNAVRYSTDEKLIEVRVTVASGMLRISVRDHGVGVEAEDQDRIWDDYYRSRKVRALGTRGSGLGLSLVQHIMKAHGGHVELVSEPGAGSTFTLVFPCVENTPEEVDNESENSGH